MVSNQRYDELDSLRGIAALIVFIYHMTIVFQWGTTMNRLSHSPFYTLFDGHASVMFFYVLSGFVLSLPFYYGKNASYGTFMAKRIIRIYIPFIVAIFIAIIMSLLFHKDGINFGSFYNLVWKDGLNLKILVNHFFLIGDYKTYSYDPAVWSLVHEMRISFIFPILMLVATKYDWKKIIIGCMLSSLSGYMMYAKFLNQANYFNRSSLYESLHYISIFMIGILLAKYHKELIELFKGLGLKFKLAILMGSLMAYGYRGWVPFYNSRLHVWFVEDWAIAIGACGLIIIVLGSKRISKILLLKPIHFLGKMSFSFYLYHFICILTLFNLLYGKIQLPYIYLSIIVASFIVSAIAYYAIEVPTIKLIKFIKSRNIIVNSKTESI